jgi:hypothetical protein
MQHPGPLHGRGVLEPLDGVAGRRGRRIALGGDDDGDRCPRTPPQHGRLAEGAGGGGVEEPADRRREPGQHDLGLRIPEPGVELDHP